MGFPNHSDKHDSEAIISPSPALDPSLVASGLVIPNAVIITYSRTIRRHLERSAATLHHGFPGPWRSMWMTDGVNGIEPVGIVNDFGVGAPAATIVLEDLIALGVKRVLSIGIAGCLEPGIDFGEVVLCTKALRDEGVSHHYLPSERFAEPAARLTGVLRETLASDGLDAHEGPSWTTDAVYRETIAEARAYQAEGILTVEMEAAALFAVAQYRDVELASAFVISDHLLTAEAWASQIRSTRVAAALVRLFDASVGALGGHIAAAA